ncbi:hypothetical protein AWB75_06386 [Caballeronia catudaia]|uniref:Uncharacterized protein n=1 Tax=Caballeronia catudaia TaxID=1777136 RepID=A0A158D8Z6_9BURK|nr:hypothetical protein [Caballeronia catudaia]SAK90961.1 hypothetical protein AWB75_06386 [Caballeronia catudaia]
MRAHTSRGTNRPHAAHDAGASRVREAAASFCLDTLAAVLTTVLMLIAASSVRTGALLFALAHWKRGTAYSILTHIRARNEAPGVEMGRVTVALAPARAARMHKFVARVLAARLVVANEQIRAAQ